VLDQEAQPFVTGRPALISLLLLAVWGGLVAGLLEVGAIVLRKNVLDSDHFHRMKRSAAAKTAHLSRRLPTVEADASV
jgi:hypothetical protein